MGILASKQIRWALTWLVVIGIATVLGSVALRFRDRVHLGEAPAPTGVRHLAAAPTVAPPNVSIYRADAAGHFFIDGEVNGAAVRFLLDTGASLVSLARQDADAAGVGPGQLSFTMTVQTANGVAHAAPVTLREIRLGQMTQEEVPGMVIDAATPYSLLGTSFLRRLTRYEIEGRELRLYW